MDNRAHRILLKTNSLFYVQVDMTYGACVAYLVDVMHSRSSEILAANLFVLLFYWPFRIHLMNSL